MRKTQYLGGFFRKKAFEYEGAFIDVIVTNSNNENPKTSWRKKAYNKITNLYFVASHNSMYLLIPKITQSFESPANSLKL